MLDLKTIIKVIVITVSAVFFNDTLIPRFLDWSSVTSLQQDEKFVMSDFYNRLAARRDIRYDSENVVCIGCDYLERDSISALLRVLADTAMLKPAAVGLDMYFSQPQTADVDKRLSSALQLLGDRLVLPVKVAPADSGLFTIVELSYAELVESLPQAHRAAINLPGHLFVNLQRAYRPVFPLAGGDSIASFAGEMVRMVSKDDYDYAVAEKSEYAKSFNICYPFVNIDTISFDRFMQMARDESSREDLRRLVPDGIIVMIGAWNDMSDMFQVPTASVVPGVMVHAYAANTMLDRQFVEMSPGWLNWLLALIFGFIYSLAMCVAYSGRFGSTGSAIVRIVTCLIVATMLVIGAYMFMFTSSHPYSLGFDKAITMLALTSLTYALYGVGEWLVALVMRKWQERKKRKATQPIKKIIKQKINKKK